ncbi:MAG: alpha/beta hydrolase [Actinomycetota bacterium]
MIAELEAIAVDGPVGPLAGWQAGPAPGQPGPVPVLFLHPVNTAGRVWEDVVAALEPGRSCLLPDLRGHGGSVLRGPFTVEGYAADALAVLDALGVERAHVVGGSLGGAIAVALAATAPDRIASIAAFGSLLSLPVSKEDLETVAQTIRTLGTRGYFEEIAPGTLSPARRSDRELLDRIVALSVGTGRTPEMVTGILLNALRCDVTAAADSVRCPSLIVTGEHDAWCTAEVGQAMAKALGTDHVVLAGVGHLPMVEEPGRVATLLADHFASAEKGQRSCA